MSWGAWLFAIEMARAHPVVSFDDKRAEYKVTPYVGTYASADDTQHASISYVDGRLRVLQDVNRGQAWLTLDAPYDLIAEPLEARGRDDLLGRHSIQRSCRVDGEWIQFTDFRTGWFRRLDEVITLHLDREILDIHRRRVFQRRGLRGFSDWSERPHDRVGWALGVDEHVRLERVSRKPQSAEEFVAASAGWAASRSNSTNVVAFPPRPACDRNFEERP